MKLPVILRSSIADELKKERVKERRKQQRKMKRALQRLAEEHVRERKAIIREKNAQIKQSDKAWNLFKEKVAVLECVTEEVFQYFETENLIEANRFKRISGIMDKIEFLKNFVLSKDEKITEISRG